MNITSEIFAHFEQDESLCSKRFGMLREGVEKGWVKTTQPIEVDGHLFISWKISNDSLYTSENALWFSDNLPRSLVSVHKSDSLEFVRLFYGLDKFGSVDEKKMGSNIRIKELIDTSVPVKISVSQKHNGEAATICGIVLNGQFYYVIMSKSVPAVVQSREQLDSLESVRFRTCKEIGTQLFDLIDQMSEEDLLDLKSLLLEYIFPIEKIDREFKHIACEQPGLYILGVRQSSSLKLVINSDYILVKMEKWGFFRAKEFDSEEISYRIQTVREKLDFLPVTSDRPSVEEFEAFAEPNNFLRVWSYVSLVYEQVVCPEITCEQILSIASGLKLDEFNLTEGSIMSIEVLLPSEDLFDLIGDVHKVKCKDLLYYLLRGVRTVVQAYKAKPYSGEPIRSGSLGHWANYLTPEWAKAWADFVGVITKYMSTPNSIQTIREICANSSTGGIDAPDFFSSASKWFELEKSGFNFKPILIVTTELEAGKVRPLITSENYEFSKVPKSDELHFGTIGMIYNAKVGMLGKLGPNISLLRFTELKVSDLEQDKKSKAFCTDLIDEKHGDIPLVVSFEDLAQAISDIKMLYESEEKVSDVVVSDRKFGSVFKVEYFDNQFRPLATSASANGYSKLMDMMTKINVYGGKFDSIPTAEQIEVSRCVELIHTDTDTQIIQRNPNTGNLVVENIIGLYQSSGNTRFAVFITGIPGLGKDWIGIYLQTQLESLIPELKDKIQVINQDMFACNADQYLSALKECVKTKSIVIITRNGPGSQKSIDTCKKAGFAIHLVCPRDSQVLLLAGGIQYSLQRSRSDTTKSHVLSSLPDEKIVSIAANFFGALGSANSSIASESTINPNTFNQSRYLAIDLEGTRHLTLEYGLITNENLIGTEIQVTSIKNVRITRENYLLEFEICQVPPSIGDIIDSHVPHITSRNSGFAKPVHSGWWAWIVQNFYSDNVGTVSFGSWEITIELCEKSQIGTVKLF